MAEELNPRATRQREILDAIQDAGRPLSPKEITEATGLTSGNVRNAVREMLDAGLLYQPEYGQYDIAENEPKDTGFGRRLRAASSQRDLEELADVAGVSFSELLSYFSGNEPALSTAAILSDELGVSLHWLITGKEKPQPESEAGAVGEPPVPYAMTPQGMGQVSIEGGEMPQHAVVKFIGLSVNGKLQVALDLLVHGRRERSNVEVDVSDVKLKSDS